MKFSRNLNICLVDVEQNDRLDLNIPVYNSVE